MTVDYKLWNDVRERLVQVIQEAVEKMNVDEPVFRLAIIWSIEATRHLPPMINLAPDTLRQKYITQEKDQQSLRQILWNPAEIGFFEDIDDPDFAETYGLLGEIIDLMNDPDRYQRLLDEVARELMKVDWQGKLTKTEDFVIYAMELEEDNFEQFIEASTSIDFVKHLQSEGLL